MMECRENGGWQGSLGGEPSHDTGSRARAPFLLSVALWKQSESPSTTITFRQALQSIWLSSDVAGAGAPWLAALQALLPINVMSSRGHVRENFQRIPGTEKPLCTTPPLPKDKRVTQKCFEHLQGTTAPSNRTGWLPQFRS